MDLPSHYLITPKPEEEAAFLAALKRSLQAGTRLLQLRGKGLDDAAYEALAEKVVPLAHGYACRVLLTGDPERVARLDADGLHLDSAGLKSAGRRPLAEGYLLAVSGHSLEALQQGEALGADFGVLSPIRYTAAHPDIEPLGWDGLAAAVSQLALPVYALGGVSAEDEAEALQSGAQGIAGHKGYWKG